MGTAYAQAGTPLGLPVSGLLHGETVNALIGLGVSRARALLALNEAQYGDTLGSYAGARPVSLYGVTIKWDRHAGRFCITSDED